MTVITVVPGGNLSREPWGVHPKTHDLPLDDFITLLLLALASLLQLTPKSLKLLKLIGFSRGHTGCHRVGQQGEGRLVLSPRACLA